LKRPGYLSFEGGSQGAGQRRRWEGVRLQAAAEAAAHRGNSGRKQADGRKRHKEYRGAGYFFGPSRSGAEQHKPRVYSRKWAGGRGVRQRGRSRARCRDALRERAGGYATKSTEYHVSGAREGRERRGTPSRLAQGGSHTENGSDPKGGSLFVDRG
jgi:hypothetical protein